MCTTRISVAMPLGAILYVGVWFCPAEYASNTEAWFMPLKTLHFLVINGIYELMLTVRTLRTPRFQSACTSTYGYMYCT